jgi:uncharacterized protein (DUF433 family)
MLSFPLNEPIPLTSSSAGVFVANTRVPLDTVVTAYLQGCSAEDIVSQYDVLKLPDVYLVIGFYLRHRSDIDLYLQQRHDQATKERAQYHSRNQQVGLRERLLARRQSQQR